MRVTRDPRSKRGALLLPFALDLLVGCPHHTRIVGFLQTGLDLLMKPTIVLRRFSSAAQALGLVRVSARAGVWLVGARVDLKAGEA